jgi:uncharacterized membrane protein YtjA (UPF0391 family)
MAKCKVDYRVVITWIVKRWPSTSQRPLARLLQDHFHANSQKHNRERNLMLGWTLIFLIVALVAGVLGFTGIAGAAIGIARTLFAIFLILFLVSLILGLAAK